MKRALSLVVSLFFVGCASIIHQTTQQVPVKSNPEGAAITVACGDVHNDPKLVTPAVVTVHRKPSHCTISLEKEGYKPSEVSLKRDMSGWYLGNILFGGIIGLVVDAANGAMYNRTPAEVNETLVKAGGSTIPPGR